MRFIVKAAFWLGLVAFLLPFGSASRETSANITFFGTLAGAQEALQDLTGFCGRAPQACATGREFAVFAGERIGDGIRMAYALVDDRAARPKGPSPAPSEVSPPIAGTASSAAAASGAPTDPVMTGTVASRSLDVAHRPAPYRAPKRVSGDAPAEADASSFRASGIATVPAPTPAPPRP